MVATPKPPQPQTLEDALAAVAHVAAAYADANTQLDLAQQRLTDATSDKATTYAALQAALADLLTMATVQYPQLSVVTVDIQP